MAATPTPGRRRALTAALALALAGCSVPTSLPVLLNNDWMAAPAPAPADVVQAGFVAPTVPPSDTPSDTKKGDAAPAPTTGGEAPKDETAKKDARPPWLSAHEQGTIITQTHPPLRSPYSGENSLQSHEPAPTTETATLFLDLRPCPGGPEIIFNPEVSGGNGLSGTHGMAGFPNGEATRVGVPAPTPYIARLLVRQTWEFDGPWEAVEDDANQFAGRRAVNRITVSAGKMAATDIADNNRYSHDPRTQFMNWSLMFNGAWDYPANVRGYTYGLAFDYNDEFCAVRYGVFAEPDEANGADFDPRFLHAQGQVLEFEEKWLLGPHPGKLSEFVFLNHAHMGKYSEALAEMPVNPDITLTRTYRFKYGFGLNLEQELSKDLGGFARLGWNDGHSESWAFTEIDRTAAAGVILKGRCWRRPDDEVGIAAVVNGLSGPHRDYLAAGGLGFIIGDGRLNYATEQIVEAYYNWQIVKGIELTFDVQGVNHPAYNADRGPVAIGTIRVHVEH